MNSKKISALIGISIIGGAIFGGNAFADTTYTSTNFPDTEFFKCVKVNAGIDSSATSITDTQLNNITDLSCGGYSTNITINNLKGMELLTNLTSFRLDHVQADSLEVNSANLTLISFDTNSIKNLTANTPKLNTLTISNSGLEKIDISKATLIDSIDLHNNNLTTIDLSKNTAITYLVLSNNKLSTIDLSNNKKLTIAFLYGNKMEYLDISTINKSVLGLYLDDNVLVRTNFIATQATKGGNYYATVNNNGGTNGMFIPMLVATRLGEKSTIVTPGASYHEDDKCALGDAFCIIFAPDVAHDLGYVQLKYTGNAVDEVMKKLGQDSSKLNYRLEINLEAWKEQNGGGKLIGVPNTGSTNNEGGNAIKIVVSLGLVATITGTIYGIFYNLKRRNNKVKFTNSKF